MPGTRFSLEVQPLLPERVARLEELANDLLYSWERPVRGLFHRLDAELWEACHHNPKVFLRRVAQARLDAAAQDRVFMDDYNRVLSSYDTYHREHARSDLQLLLDPEEDLVAYFCAEFGFHESFPIYSGGLGILAGDYCKAASDLGLPFVAVGLLYRQGYFSQTIDGHGNQVAHYAPIRFSDLPVRPATAEDGSPVTVSLALPGRSLRLNVWEAKAGHIRLVLLDSDLPENDEDDRAITYQLYGGDEQTRIQQEMVLGIAGVRALRALGLEPTVWHINEGHAAFSILERCRTHVAAGMTFPAALELVAAGTVFTTHTPVPAGHDIFPRDLVGEYLGGFAGELGLDLEGFLALGALDAKRERFNQTTLALQGSRFHNGVSAIHGSVAAEMEREVWPQVPAGENPLTHVTNGIHVPTFLARDWLNLFDMRFSGQWRNEQRNEAYWERIEEIPDHNFWSVRQSLKMEMLADVRRRVVAQYRRNGVGPTQVERLVRHLDPDNPDILTIGFARRFATYKRATLWFADPARLARLLNDPERPAVLIFAGKAHPKDTPGQDLIRAIHGFARRPEFEGRIVLVEGYDMALARKLVAGCDVWANTPEYPLEASGTSGQKAGINGVVNLSVLDGWWGEGYNGENGWAITPHPPETPAENRDAEESRELLDLLEFDVAPLYYARGAHGYSEGWVRLSKASMKSLIPRFNAQRMVMDYVMKLYGPANWQRRALGADEGAPARALAEWKARVANAWPSVRLHLVAPPADVVASGETLSLAVGVELAGLSPEDVVVECLTGSEGAEGFAVAQRTALKA
ncbi:MAG: alpha-glucan family phosphorylase, partial [Gammaproteobacteria bacterium]|nr:alpha-glucan family phosphorylase [Gammaproteobacteria bacterium]